MPVQHAEPGVAELLEHGHDFVNALARLFQIALEQPALKKTVKIAERVGQLAAGFEVQRAVQLADDIHGVLEIVMNGRVALADFGELETEQRAVQRQERAVKQHQTPVGRAARFASQSGGRISKDWQAAWRGRLEGLGTLEAVREKTSELVQGRVRWIIAIAQQRGRLRHLFRADLRRLFQ